MVVQEGCVKLLPVDHASAIDKLIDYVPDLIEKVTMMLQKQLKDKAEQIEKTNKLIEENVKKQKHQSIAETKAEPNTKQKPEIKKKHNIDHKEKTKNEEYEYEYDETGITGSNDVIDEEDLEQEDYDD